MTPTFFAMVTAVTILAPPAAPPAGESPRLTPQEELALADDLLFCANLLTTLSESPQFEAEGKKIGDQGKEFVTLAATLIPRKSWGERMDASFERFTDWMREPGWSKKDVVPAVSECVRKRDDNSAWIKERQKAKPVQPAKNEDN